MKDKIGKILREAGVSSPLQELVKLHGDASYRTYYRAILKNGQTRIVMQMPKGLSSVSEEITNFNGTHKELPFINIARFLASLGLPVPKIYHYSEDDKIIILEDAGDGLLSGVVKGASEDLREEWYKKAIDLLIEVQRRTSLCSEKGRCVAFQRSFDAALLNWEFDHFREYLIEARSGRPMKENDRRFFEEAARKITDEILKMPYCFTHRDFQSRNLLIQKDGSFVMLDFQDALQGPCIYDLVSLLRDSYVELEWETVEKLIEYYCAQNRLKHSNTQTLKHFQLVTIQRKMKDAGRFVYIDRVKKNPNFLQFIPASLRYIKNALENTQTLKHLNTSALCEALKTYVPEWQ